MLGRQKHSLSLWDLICMVLGVPWMGGEWLKHGGFAQNGKLWNGGFQVSTPLPTIHLTRLALHNPALWSSLGQAYSPATSLMVKPLK